MAADTSTIGVSCGHRVPRDPIVVGPRKLYWCAECGEHRMSGGSSTGERGHDWARQLRELIALEDDSGRPIVLTVKQPLAPHAQRLMDSLGVEVRIVSDIAVDRVRRAQVAHTEGHYVVDGDREPFVENWIDFRHSLVVAAKRADAHDETLEICPHCMCEVDVDPQPHRPGCPGIGRPRATSAPVLAKLAEEDSSSERAVEPEPEEGPRSPTPDAGGLDEQQSPMGARTAEATDATGEPEPRPAPNGAPIRWDRDSIIAAIVSWNDEHGRPPTKREWKQAGDGHPNEYAVKVVFGSWASAIEAAGFPKPTRGTRAGTVRVSRPQAEVAEREEAASEERVTRRTVGAGRGPRSSDAGPVEAPPVALDTAAIREHVLATVNSLFALLDEIEAQLKAASA